MDKYNKELVTIIGNHYQIPKSEAEEYITIFLSNSNTIDNLISILKMYGKTDKEIKGLLK